MQRVTPGRHAAQRQAAVGRNAEAGPELGHRPAAGAEQLHALGCERRRIRPLDRHVVDDDLGSKHIVRWASIPNLLAELYIRSGKN